MMNHRDKKTPQGSANPSNRARLDALLFNGAKVGTTLLALSLFLEPKFPVFVGE